MMAARLGTIPWQRQPLTVTGLQIPASRMEATLTVAAIRAQAATPVPQAWTPSNKTKLRVGARREHAILVFPPPLPFQKF